MFTTDKPLLITTANVPVRPKPFLKWAGGKSQLLKQYRPFLPARFGCYYEPFTGSAAVYWYLFSLRESGEVSFRSTRLTDSNAELINCYTVVRDKLNDLVELLALHRCQHSRDYYYYMRGLSTKALSDVELAARFIYLNKTCFNGLYRVNRSGDFNVPIGNYANPRIFDAGELESASNALQNVELAVADFEDVLKWASDGDFVYFDPPYAPVSSTSSFTNYTETPFGEDEQERLATVLHVLNKRGCKVMLSNSWVDSILALYKDFNCIEVKASRAINSNPDKRGKISELLVLNYAT